MQKNLTAQFAGLVLAVLLGWHGVTAQPLTMPPSGDNKKASVSEGIGITDVTIHYSRPAVRGREGKIWGQLVPYGFNDLGFGPRKPAPWRAGANENTTITFGDDVKVEGQDLPAGTYGLHMALEADACTVIFSKNHTSWGSYYYDPAEDALRVTVKPVKTEQSQEWLKYEFRDQTPNSAVIALEWEKLRIPFKVEVDVHKTVLASMRRQLRNEPGFTWEGLNAAATYCLNNNINLEEALTWSEQSISMPYIGQANFFTLSTKAQLLELLGRQPEADATMKLALEKGDLMQIHGYGRQLQSRKKYKEALDVFLLNAKKNGGAWPINVGLARGYAGVGDNKKALKHAKLALAQAPDHNNKSSLENMIKNLEEGKAVN
jgi:tetratricopeptide (TPR) repeat protein